MKKFALLTVLLGLAAVSTEAATIYLDTDDFSTAGTPGQLINSGGSFTGNFNIATDDADGIADDVGYVLGSGGLTALAGFTFTGQDLTTHSYSYQLENQSTLAGNSFLLTFGEDHVLGSALVTLTADGNIDFTINNTGATEFFLSTAVLRTFQEPSSNVPDGGATVITVGLGLLGLGVLRRKA